MLENGSKWSALSRILLNRTEHVIKNRYFSLIRNFFSIPIKIIKKQKNYLDKFLIKEILKNYQNEENEFNVDFSLDQISDSSNESSNNENLCLFPYKKYETFQQLRGVFQ